MSLGKILHARRNDSLLIGEALRESGEWRDTASSI